MTNRTTISVVALLAALSISAPALSQTADADVGAGVSIGVGDADVDVGAGVNVGADTDDGDAAVGVDANVGVSGGGGDDDSNVNADVNAGVSASGGDDADDASVNADVNATLNGNNADADADVNASIDIAAIDDDDARLQAIIDLSAGGNANDDLSADIDDTNVVIVDVDDDLGAEGTTKLMASLDENDEGLSNIRTAIQSNSELAAVLEAEGVDTDDVVGGQINGNGSTTIFVADGILNLNCGTSVDVSAQPSSVEPAVIESADLAILSVVEACEVGNLDMSITSAQRTAIDENEALTQDIQGKGFTTADILAVTSLGGNSLNIFVEDDDV